MPAQMFFDLAGPGRGIEGYRHQSRVEHPEKAEEIIDIGRQHDGNGIPRSQRQGLQQGGYLPGPLPQFPVADQPFLPALQQEDVAGIGVGSGLLFQHLDEGDSRMYRSRRLPRRRESRRAISCPPVASSGAAEARWRRISRGVSAVVRTFSGRRTANAFSRRASSSMRARLSRPRSAIKPAVEGDRQTGCGLGSNSASSCARICRRVSGGGAVCIAYLEEWGFRFVKALHERTRAVFLPVSSV